MKKLSFLGLIFVLFVSFGLGSAMAFTTEDLAKASALEEILKRGELRVGLEAGYQPFEMQDEKGNIVGFDVDIAYELGKAIFGKGGEKKVKIINTAWEGIIPALMTHKFDIIMSGMTILQSRNLKVNFCDPYYYIGQCLLINKKNKDKYKSYKDLNKKGVIITSKLGVTGAFTAERLMPKATLRLFKTEAEGALQVANGLADAFIYDEPQVRVFAAKYKETTFGIFKPLTYEPLGWAIRKGDPDFLNFLNNFLRQIRGDGRWEKLKKKWFVDYIEKVAQKQ
ncbi:MAG: transporter substrate-binding domain-containing protein [Deltaproteobacteria bacterium]|nr:transporter substrate-binding domain-containing protein [Deltaproteobacteria bacterium]MBW1928461.1 transporter substrate-binding domain-containing protein [Deltaproteobacteria bacterium]MBW2024204.1 transporter substrate-binding domain-containing protein [Deltaproteobacteria bacterium]MBW2124907.1 transporter substrate-binding domain-containing protein [Deltaproteobacteria bacterium]RLB23314.1 MAG: amino acid ABC transporter substrate-binding protein [Deltaproteobacteria bacterium]